MCVEPVCVWNVEHMHNVCGVWRVCVWMSECWSVDVCGECTVRAKFGVFVHAPVGQVLERVHAAPHVQCARAGAERAPAPPLRPGPVCGGCCRAGRRERAASEAAPLRNAERRGRVTGRGGPGVPGLKRAGSRWGGRGHVQDVLQGERRGLRGRGWGRALAAWPAGSGGVGWSGVGWGGRRPPPAARRRLLPLSSRPGRGRGGSGGAGCVLWVCGLPACPA